MIPQYKRHVIPSRTFGGGVQLLTGAKFQDFSCPMCARFHNADVAFEAFRGLAIFIGHLIVIN